MSEELDDKEIKEIISLLKEAKMNLFDALDKLDSASTYSILDIFLGGALSLVADAFEYKHFSEAKEYVNEAGRILRRVREKISKIHLSVPGIDHTTLWAVLDIGFDSLLIDLMRHYKIKQAKEELEKTIENIDKLIKSLEKL